MPGMGWEIMAIYALNGIRPQMPETGNCWVAPSADLIGKVKLDERASVWFGAVLRGDNELIHIGENSNIQDGCTLHTDPGFPLIVGRDVTVGHGAILHGCTVEDGALVGMHATILNGAVIGSGSIIGANSLVSEGKVIPKNSLVLGVPGRVVKTLGDEQAAEIARLSGIYVRRQAEYIEGLELVE